MQITQIKQREIKSRQHNCSKEEVKTETPQELKVELCTAPHRSMCYSCVQQLFNEWKQQICRFIKVPKDTLIDFPAAAKVHENMISIAPGDPLVA